MKPDQPAGVPQPANPGWAEAVLAAWCAAVAVIMLWGAALSSWHALAAPAAWLAGLIFAAGAAFAAGRALRPPAAQAGAGGRIRAAVRAQPALLVLGAGLAAVLTAGALTAFGAAPSNWDSLTYHLARVGYYLQQGTLDDFGANFFAQEQNARGASIVLCALFAVCGRSDALFALPQLLGYATCLVSVYALARRLGRSLAAALAAAAVFGLLTIAAMEAPTAQDDLVLASFVGAGLVGLLAWLAHGKNRHLLLGAGGFALALAVKASALTCVPAALLVLAVAAGRRAPGLRRAAWFSAATIIAIALLAWPAGYWKNWRRFGNPIGGPPMFAHHTNPGRDGPGRMHMGALNLVRFAGDLCTLDGLPESWAGGAGSAVKRAVGAAAKAAGVDAESPAATRSPFRWSRPRFADENLSFFGWPGIALLLPGCLGALARRRREPLAFAFALAFPVFLVGQAFAGPYDPWRGRHFLYGAVFAAPAAAWLFDSSRPDARRAAWAAAIVAAIAIGPALLWRSPNPLLSRAGARSLFALDRLAQMARHHPSYPALAAFARLVPADATVIVALPENEYEYALFGRGLRRRLIPYAQAQKHPELAARADYLLYDRWLRVPREADDVFLGYHWNLRRLKASATP